MSILRKPITGSILAGLTAVALYSCTGGEFAGTSAKKNLALKGGADANDGDGAGDAADGQDDQGLRVPVGSTKPLPGVDKSKIKSCTVADPKIASVDPAKGCLVTGVKEGVTTIDAILEDGEKVKIKVTVTPAGSADASGGMDSNDGGDSGGIDGEADASGGGGKDDDDDGGDDDDEPGLDDGDTTSANLRGPMILKQLLLSGSDADCEAKVDVQYIDSKGGAGPVTSHAFQEHQAGQVSVPNICHKREDTTIKVVFHLCDETVTPAVTGSVGKTGGGFNSIEVTADDEPDGTCLLGKCIDRGKDNTFVFECAGSKHDLIIQDLK